MRLLLVTAWLFGASWATAQEPAARANVQDVEVLDQLQIGHWVEVRGALGREGFDADRIELRRPRSRAVMWGVAERGATRGGLKVLGRELDIDASTRWRGGSRQSALGRRVRVSGQRSSGNRIRAERIEIRAPGVERIEGRIDRIDATANGVRLRILGYTVSVDRQAKQRLAVPLAGLDLAPPAPLRSPSSGVYDTDDLFGDGFRLGANSHLGIQQDVSFNSRRNFELDARDDTDADDLDDRDDASHNLRARSSWTPNARVTAVADVRHRARRRELDGGSSSSSGRLRLGEAFVLARDIGFGLDLQVGRQDHDEPREWLYDQNLDGVRLFRQTRSLRMELSASTTLSDGSSRDRDAVNTIFYVARRQGRRHLAAYVIHRDFRGGRDERQSHLGLRLLGPWTERLRGWLELSALDGERAGREVAAWGGDVGVSWVAHAPSRTTLSAGVAYGSGDRGGSSDRRFRQTGLQDNNARLGGVTAVRYYGELFDPELSNLQILTLGAGTRFWRRSSIELIAHRYRQAVASTRLTNTNLDRRPDGLSRDLGWELDLVVGVRRFARWDVELVGAYFEQGIAFGPGDSATLANLQIRYRY